MREPVERRGAGGRLYSTGNTRVGKASYLFVPMGFLNHWSPKHKAALPALKLGSLSPTPTATRARVGIRIGATAKPPHLLS